MCRYMCDRKLIKNNGTVSWVCDLCAHAVHHSTGARRLARGARSFAGCDAPCNQPYIPR